MSRVNTNYGRRDKRVGPTVDGQIRGGGLRELFDMFKTGRIGRRGYGRISRKRSGRRRRRGGIALFDSSGVVDAAKSAAKWAVNTTVTQPLNFLTSIPMGLKKMFGGGIAPMRLGPSQVAVRKTLLGGRVHRRRRGRGLGSKLAVLGPLALAGAMALRHLKKRR